MPPRLITVPPVPARTITLKPRDKRTTAYILAKELHITQKEIADEARVAAAGVTRMLLGQIHASANVRQATIRTFAQHGFEFDEVTLFGDVA